ncbi:DDE-type integrase/transposase/recombinase [Arthrobacter sp. EPSL27]|uniref:DDE-type integrase/transposase/recombinase n=1 Tax=Arthrobacter sp. EPSL27 TaxID=1745378 RepID=UPI000747E1A0|nr:DDE-type integrase/transposase/recombinase [Arthrobacter sp. EPSL27]KUM41136.1 hypothetical protein AR539_00370 [Arthrobacter sp. EPSL27]
MFGADTPPIRDGENLQEGAGETARGSRGTVDRPFEADRPPKYERKPTGSSFDAYTPRVRALLVQTPTMPASVLAERTGWAGSASYFRDVIRAIRPEYLPADPVDRLVHEPGQAMQCDLWFLLEPLPLGHGQEGKPPVPVMMSAFSGYIQDRILPTRTTFDLLGGIWSLLQEAGAVPNQLVWDNESGIGQGLLTEPAAAFAGVLGCEIRQLPPRDPQAPGMVERMNRYFRQHFMPGRAFASPLDFHAQLADWLPRANARYSRTRQGRPAELIVRDRRAMRRPVGKPPDLHRPRPRGQGRLPPADPPQRQGRTGATRSTTVIKGPDLQLEKSTLIPLSAFRKAPQQSESSRSRSWILAG